MKKHENFVIDIIEFIENNIYKSIDLNQISEAFNISRFHLNRIFKNLTNETLMNYIRNRKLARSLDFLDNLSYRIIDIALMFGFNFEQSYIRAFKSEFNITPHQYRKKKPILEIAHKLTLSDFHIMENGMILLPKKIYFPRVKLVGKTCKMDKKDPDYKYQANMAAVKFFLEDSKQIDGDVNRYILYSLVKLTPGERDPYEYTPSLSYSKDVSCPKDMSLTELVPESYIVFKYIGNHSPYKMDMTILKNIYDYIYNDCKDYITEKCKLDYRVEIIDESICNENYCEMEILFSVKEMVVKIQDTNGIL